MSNTIPSPNAGAGDDAQFRNYGGKNAPDAQMTVIGGTHNVSVKLNPDQCLRGPYQPIPGDTMPSGAPVDGSPAYNGPILPEN